jgi:hypothetical protein
MINSNLFLIQAQTYVKLLPGDQEGLFKLAIQLTTFFLFGYLQHCNPICFVGLFDRYLT